MIKMDQSNVTTNLSGLTATDFLAFWVFFGYKNIEYVLLTGNSNHSTKSDTSTKGL